MGTIDPKYPLFREEVADSAPQTNLFEAELSPDLAASVFPFLADSYSSPELSPLIASMESDFSSGTFSYFSEPVIQTSSMEDRGDADIQQLSTELIPLYIELAAQEETPETRFDYLNGAMLLAFHVGDVALVDQVAQAGEEILTDSVPERELLLAYQSLSQGDLKAGMNHLLAAKDNPIALEIKNNLIGRENAEKTGRTLLLTSLVIDDFFLSVENSSQSWMGKLESRLSPTGNPQAYLERIRPPLLTFLGRWEELAATGDYARSEDIYYVIQDEGGQASEGYQIFSQLINNDFTDNHYLDDTQHAAIQEFILSESASTYEERVGQILQAADRFLLTNGESYGAAYAIGELFSNDPQFTEDAGRLMLRAQKMPLFNSLFASPEQLAAEVGMIRLAFVASKLARLKVLGDVTAKSSLGLRASAASLELSVESGVFTVGGSLLHSLANDPRPIWTKENLAHQYLSSLIIFGTMKGLGAGLRPAQQVLGSTKTFGDTAGETVVDFATGSRLLALNVKGKVTLAVTGNLLAANGMALGEMGAEEMGIAPENAVDPTYLARFLMAEATLAKLAIAGKGLNLAVGERLDPSKYVQGQMVKTRRVQIDEMLAERGLKVDHPRYNEVVDRVLANHLQGKLSLHEVEDLLDAIALEKSMTPKRVVPSGDVIDAGAIENTAYSSPEEIFVGAVHGDPNALIRYAERKTVIDEGRVEPTLSTPIAGAQMMALPHSGTIVPPPVTVAVIASDGGTYNEPAGHVALSLAGEDKNGEGKVLGMAGAMSGADVEFTELVKYFREGDIHFTYDTLERIRALSEDELHALMVEPSRGRGLGIEEDEIAFIEEWLAKKQGAIQMGLSDYEKLKAANPENPLFRENLPPSPPHYVTVYRSVPEKYLADIAENGLRPIGQHNRGEKIEKIFRDVGNQMGIPVSREGAIFAYHSSYESRAASWHGRDLNTRLEFQVDPDRAYVVNAEYFTDARFDSSTGKNSAQNYWSTAITLREYLSLPVDERRWKFSFPEVLVPETIPPTHVRVVPAPRDWKKATDISTTEATPILPEAESVMASSQSNPVNDTGGKNVEVAAALAQIFKEARDVGGNEASYFERLEQLVETVATHAKGPIIESSGGAPFPEGTILSGYNQGFCDEVVVRGDRVKWKGRESPVTWAALLSLRDEAGNTVGEYDQERIFRFDEKTAHDLTTVQGSLDFSLDAIKDTVRAILDGKLKGEWRQSQLTKLDETQRQYWGSITQSRAVMFDILYVRSQIKSQLSSAELEALYASRLGMREREDALESAAEALRPEARFSPPVPLTSLPEGSIFYTRSGPEIILDEGRLWLQEGGQISGLLQEGRWTLFSSTDRPVGEFNNGSITTFDIATQNAVTQAVVEYAKLFLSAGFGAEHTLYFSAADQQQFTDTVIQRLHQYEAKYKSTIEKSILLQQNLEEFRTNIQTAISRGDLGGHVLMDQGEMSGSNRAKEDDVYQWYERTWNNFTKYCDRDDWRYGEFRDDLNRILDSKYLMPEEQMRAFYALDMAARGNSPLIDMDNTVRRIVSGLIVRERAWQEDPSW